VWESEAAPLDKPKVLIMINHNRPVARETSKGTI
jgi:hypothetical protein